MSSGRLGLQPCNTGRQCNTGQSTRAEVAEDADDESEELVPLEIILPSGKRLSLQSPWRTSRNEVVQAVMQAFPT